MAIQVQPPRLCTKFQRKILCFKLTHQAQDIPNNGLQQDYSILLHKKGTIDSELSNASKVPYICNKHIFQLVTNLFLRQHIPQRKQRLSIDPPPPKMRMATPSVQLHTHFRPITTSHILLNVRVFQKKNSVTRWSNKSRRASLGISSLVVI